MGYFWVIEFLIVWKWVNYVMGVFWKIVFIWGGWRVGIRVGCFLSYRFFVCFRVYFRREEFGVGFSGRGGLGWFLLV